MAAVLVGSAVDRGMDFPFGVDRLVLGLLESGSTVPVFVLGVRPMMK